jgi:hypothetical protein
VACHTGFDLKVLGASASQALAAGMHALQSLTDEFLHFLLVPAGLPGASKADPLSIAAIVEDLIDGQSLIDRWSGVNFARFRPTGKHRRSH